MQGWYKRTSQVGVHVQASRVMQERRIQQHADDITQSRLASVGHISCAADMTLEQPRHLYRMNVEATVKPLYGLCAVLKLRRFDIRFNVSSILGSPSASPAVDHYNTVPSRLMLL